MREMLNKITSSKIFAYQSFRYMALAAALIFYILIVSGGIVRVTGSGGACPDWPTCFGQWTPPGEGSAVIDYLHRLATFLVAPLILMGVLLTRREGNSSWIRRAMIAALVLLLIQIGLGAWVARSGNGPWRSWISSAHLGLSLLAQGALIIATVSAFYRHRHPEAPNRFVFQTPFGRLTLWTLLSVFILLVSGKIVAATGSSTACPGWPSCGPELMPISAGGWVQMVHRLLVGLSTILVAASFVQAWRTQRSQTPVIVATTAMTVLFFSQALLGAKLVDGIAAYLLVIHAATAAAVWGAMVVQAAVMGLTPRSAEDEQLEAQALKNRTKVGWDLLMLTKPIVVALLLVTTYAGMVIGARAWPSLALTFWTLLGGFMAAGGSGAINQYIDRFDDSKMQRTQKRPIPAGRLTAGEGLAFGVGMALASFYLMVAFVNLLAALLTLAGFFYYVLLYSIFLKKTTVQNIVIGGGAGAIPPLVGWAAATGSLDIPSLFLFAVVFMWTPPHFWALALVRRKDYARAGVPMLPVVRGEEETRWQIFVYTAELVALTLFLPLFGLGGSIYLVGALFLGAWLLLSAWKVWKQGGNKLAWKMYRYSSMYLAFLFVILMIDRLIL